MENLKIYFLILIFMFNNLILVLCDKKINNRNKRYMIFPETAPTRHQLISGVGIPVTTEEAVILGWVWKAQYFLPVKATDLRPAAYYLRKKRNTNIDTKNPVEFIDEKTGQKVEKYEVEAIEIETKPLYINASSTEENTDEFDDYSLWTDEGENNEINSNNMENIWEPKPADANKFNKDNSRWAVYKSLEAIAERNGFKGKSCILRSICEASHIPFTYQTGILGELLHVILRPSTTSEPFYHHGDTEYLKAEEMGKSGMDCGEIFPECKQSLLSIFTKSIGSLVDIENLFKFK